MDTSILHTRIKDFKAKANNPVSKEMILLFESWFTTIENYLSDIEMDNIRLNMTINKQQELINLLCDMLIISGNADKLILDINDEHTKEAIYLILKNKDRLNHGSITSISTLLKIHSDKNFNSLKELKEYATR